MDVSAPDGLKCKFWQDAQCGELPLKGFPIFLLNATHNNS